MALQFLSMVNMAVPPIETSLWAAWITVVSGLPDTCPNNQPNSDLNNKQDKLLHFAIFEWKIKDTELSTIQNNEADEGNLQRVDMIGDNEICGGNFGSSRHKISEFQARWNICLASVAKATTQLKLIGFVKRKTSLHGVKAFFAKGMS